MRIWCRMETGLGKREIEDRVLVNSTILAGGEYSLEGSLQAPAVFAVADGVGGNLAGNRASQMVLEGLKSMNLEGISTEDRLKALIRRVNAGIVEFSKGDERCEKMATTLSGLMYTGERWLLFHVGNSRIYAFERPYLKQLTDDHSLSQEMREAGFSEEEIRRSGRSSSITSCLGNGDVSMASKLEVFDVTSELDSAEAVYLTSDGIHDFIPHQMLERGVSSDTPAGELLRLCMELARSKGSADDLSMLCLTFEGDRRTEESY